MAQIKLTQKNYVNQAQRYAQGSASVRSNP